MTRDRRGYTLIELGVVLAILSVMTLMVLPAVADLGRTPPRQFAGEIRSLLADARRIAIDSNVTVTVLLNPETGEYEVDSVGTEGAGIVWDGELDLANTEPLATDQFRLRYYFQPTGAAIGDTVRVQGTDSSSVLWIDPWDGRTHVGDY